MERHPGTNSQTSLDDLLARVEDLEARVAILEAQAALDSITALRALDTEGITAGATVMVKAWRPNGTTGGGHFRYMEENTDNDDGGFTIVDALDRRWVRINTYEVTPEMFGARNDSETDDSGAFNRALAVCAVNGYDFSSSGNYWLEDQLVCYPERNFYIRFVGTYTFPAGSDNAGLYIEPTLGGGYPDIFAGQSEWLTGDTVHTLLLYDNFQNINETNKYTVYYGLRERTGAITHIEGFEASGSGAVTATGWYRGIVTNCLPTTIQGCRITGQKGTPSVAGVAQSTTGLGHKGLFVGYRDYDALDITDFAVDAGTGEVTVTYTGDFPVEKSYYVFFDNFDGDLGKAINWSMCKIFDVDNTGKTFKLKNYDGRWLPAYTSGGTFEGSPAAATQAIIDNKLQWYDTLIHLGQTEGYWIENNRVIGGSTGILVEEQLSVEFVGYNHCNVTWRGIVARGVGGLYGGNGLIYARNPTIFLAGITLTKGSSTTGAWTSGTQMPWQMQNDTWVTFLTTETPNNVADIDGSNPSYLLVTYTGANDFTNGNSAILSNLPENWDVLYTNGESVTGTISDVNTTNKTFRLNGIDGSAITVSYLDSIEETLNEDGEIEFDYATVQSGMYQITESYYKLANVDRSLRTFEVVNAVTGAAVNSNSWNTWSAGRMHVVGRPMVLERCKGILLEAWKFTGVNPGRIRGIELINCKVASGSYIGRNIIQHGTYAAIELHGNTDYVRMADQRITPQSVELMVWDNTDGPSIHNILLDRDNPRTQNFSAASTTISASGLSNVFLPPRLTTLYQFAGTAAVGAMQNRDNGVTQHIVNATDGQAAGAGLLILKPHSTGNSKTILRSKMPRFLMPGAGAPFIYNSSDAAWWEQSDTNWKAIFDYFDDCFTSLMSPNASSGAGASVSVSTFHEGHSTRKPLGIFELATGTTNTGAASFGPLAYDLRIDQGAQLWLSRFALGALSDGTDTYEARTGLYDSPAGTVSVADGAYWNYTHGASTFWQTKTAANSVVTTTTTSLLAAINDYYYLGIFVNGNGTRADFFSFVDPADITIHTSHTTNIPLTTRRCGFGTSIHKTVGTNSRSLYLDFQGLAFCSTRGR